MSALLKEETTVRKPSMGDAFNALARGEAVRFSDHADFVRVLFSPEFKLGNVLDLSLSGTMCVDDPRIGECEIVGCGTSTETYSGETLAYVDLYPSGRIAAAGPKANAEEVCDAVLKDQSLMGQFAMRCIIEQITSSSGQSVQIPDAFPVIIGLPPTF